MSDKNSIQNSNSKGGSRDFETRGALCRQPCLANEENFRFLMSEKAKTTSETVTSW